MRLPLCSACPVLLFGLLGTSVGIRVSVLVDEILSVRKHYSSMTVFFIHPEDQYGSYGDMQIMQLIHTSSRLLNRHYIRTVDVNFKRLWRLLRYRHQIVQPISIVIIPDFKSYLEFAEATKTYPMSFSIWFTLFLYTPNNDTHDYCREPIGNPFNLVFDTEMLVLCHNETILREWYSIKGETVKIFDLAEWKDGNEGFIPLTNLSLFERRKNMEGLVLRAVAVKDVSDLNCTENDNLATMYGKVLKELTRSLNFTLKIVLQLNEYGLWDHQKQTWSGVIGEIVSGRADFAIADFTMTALRVRYVDFTLPLITSRNSLYIKEPEMCGVKWLGYFQTLNLYTWITIIILLAIASLLLSFMKMYSESRSIADLISENFIYVWGIFCSQGLTEFPKILSLRIAYFTIFLTSILTMAHYSAALVCFLTTCNRILPFRTLNEFVHDGTYKLVVPRGSVDYDTTDTFQTNDASTKDMSLKLMKLMKDEQELPEDLLGGFMQVCKERKVAFLVLNALKERVERSIPCKLSRIDTAKIHNLGMILTKGSPYTRVINYHLQKFFDNGMIMRLRDTKILPQSTKDKTYMPVRLVNVIPILAISCGGIIVSVTVLIIEKIHYRSNRKKFQSKILYPIKLFNKKINN